MLTSWLQMRFPHPLGTLDNLNGKLFKNISIVYSCNRLTASIASPKTVKLGKNAIKGGLNS